MKDNETLSFPDAAAFYAWLAKHHARSAGVFVRMAKRGVDGLSYADALDVALAWGWIDGQKKRLDARYWLQRFSRRAAKSQWSKANRSRAEKLLRAGKLEAPGLAEVERARADGRWERAYDGARSANVPDDFAAALDDNPKARAFFDALDRANRYAILYRLQTAKSEQTRARRIERFVTMCANGETIHPPRRA